MLYSLVSVNISGLSGNRYRCQGIKSINLLPQRVSVISAAGDESISIKIAQILDAQFVSAEVRVFSDGESKIRIPVKVEDSALIVQSTSPPTDSNLMKLLMIAAKCFQDGCRNICAVVPYLAYARQDRVFLDGEIATVTLVSRLLEAAGIRHVITVDIHSERAVSCFNIPMTNVSAIPLLAAYAKNIPLVKPTVISPDSGGENRAKQFADILETDSFSLKKNRSRETGDVTISNDHNLNVTDRDCIIVDDMISSGASIVEAANLLKKNGAKSIIAACTHALLVGDAADRIKSAGVEEIIATNSVAGPYSKVDLSSTIAETARVHCLELA